jgi:hypothetical protein
VSSESRRRLRYEKGGSGTGKGVGIGSINGHSFLVSKTKNLLLMPWGSKQQETHPDAFRV